MFRQEKPVLPFNEIHHLTGESFGFAVNLRRDVKEKAAEERKASAPTVVANNKVGSDGRRVKDEFAVKETNCANRNCLENNYIFAMEFMEVRGTNTSCFCPTLLTSMYISFFICE
jgi:hypothetical protein